MSEPQQKENQGKGPSGFSQILDGAREVVHSAIEHALVHGAAHAAEHKGKALITILRKTYPGTCVLKPLPLNSVWLWKVEPLFRAAGKVIETGGRILGSTAFTIATELLQSDESREYTGDEENRDLEGDRREARVAAAREPKIEQGIAYKNGSVYFPVSRQWILPPVIIRASHPGHSSSHPPHTHHAHTHHAKASLHVHAEVVGHLSSLPSALGLSVQRPAHLPGNHIMIKAVPISTDHGASDQGQRLDRLGSLVDLFLSACVHPSRTKI